MLCVAKKKITAINPPAKSCHTVHSNAAAGFLSKLGVEQLEPVIHNLGWRRGAIIKGPVLQRENEDEDVGLYVGKKYI